MMGLGMGLFGFFWMFLFWGGLIALAIWLIKLLFPTAEKSEGSEKEALSAQKILQTRYTQGELTTEQYQEMLQTIRQ